MFVWSFYWIVVYIGFRMSAKSTVNHFSFGFPVLCPVSGYLHFVLAKNSCFEFWSVHLSVWDIFSSARVITVRHSIENCHIFEMKLF